MPIPPPASHSSRQAAGATTLGADGVLVAVTATITAGPGSFRIDGVPVAGAFEARDRIRAAILNSGLPWPGRTITVSVQPAGLSWHDPGLDLAIALAVISASTGDGLLSRGCACIAELGLDGSLRPVPGVLPAVIATAGRYAHVIVAPESEAQAAAVPGVTAVPARSLRDAMVWLRTRPRAAGPTRDVTRRTLRRGSPQPDDHPCMRLIDFDSFGCR
jgi:magnesium chelatase family protein